MRLLLIAGLRQNLNWLKWVERHAVEFDIVAIVGDTLDVFHPLPPHAETVKSPNPSGIAGWQGLRRGLL